MDQKTTGRLISSFWTSSVVCWKFEIVFKIHTFSKDVGTFIRHRV